MSHITDILEELAPNAHSNYVLGFRNNEELLTQHEITTPLRIAHFLAQVLYESGGCRILEENLSYGTAERLLLIFGAGHHSAGIQEDEAAGLLHNPEALAERVYGLGNRRKARELGNENAGDGYKYRGRGPLQTTGGANYRHAADRCGVDFYANPDSIIAPENILSPAVNEWSDGALNDAADRNDIRTITKTINGGYNGFAEREAWLQKIWPLANGGEAPAAWQEARSDGATRWLQRALNDLGARPVLEVDGLYGPDTTAAVEWFQTIASLKVDGVAGDVTRAAIRLKLAAIRAG